MRLVLLVAIVAVAGCASVDQDVTHLQQEQDAISAAIKKIKVVHGPTVKGHPQYTTLGRAEGYCFNRSQFHRRPGRSWRRPPGSGVSQVWRPGRRDREYYRMVRGG